MKIITISREFGSGGRELGKRMADILNFAFYDKEIIDSIAQTSDFDIHYASNNEESNDSVLALSVAHTFELSATGYQQNTGRILMAQNKAIKELASRGKDCIIVGRSADVLLQEYNPLNLFVYADMQTKINRCRDRLLTDENLTEEEIEFQIHQVDGIRAKYRSLLTNRKRGQKENYHLCVNTTEWVIKDLAPMVAEYTKAWFARSIEKII